MFLIQERSKALAEVNDAKTRADTNVNVLQVTKCNKMCVETRVLFALINLISIKGVLTGAY